MNLKTFTTANRMYILAGSGIGVMLILGLVANMVWQSPDLTAHAETDTRQATVNAEAKRVPVVLTSSKAMTFERRIVVSGTIRSKRYALVSARIPGTLDSILVDEGDCVKATQTRLFQTDSLKLNTAVAIAEQALRVAQSVLREKQAALEKACAIQEQSHNDVNRYRELAKCNAIAKQALEHQESHCKQAGADVKHAEALIALAEAQLEQAQLNLTIARKDLADSLVLAPVSGRISTRFREPGEMAAAGTPVLRIDDLSLLEISVFLPEEHYACIVPEQTKMRVCTEAIDLGERKVCYKSPTVDEEMRTFEVKCLVESPPDGIVPGCLAEATIVADSHQGIGVPIEAVQIRGGKPVVFTVERGIVKTLSVDPGYDSDGWREILDGFPSGVPVVSMGQFLVEEGTQVIAQQQEER